MKIDYKITTIVLIGILLITYAWHWQDILDHDKKMTNDMANMEMSKMDMRGMQHTMPDGSLMNEGMMMKKGSDTSIDMGSMSMNDMAEMMKGKTGKDLEKEFLTGMIPHHAGAVDMAQAILADKTTSPRIRAFAETIIKAQDAEIVQMKEWLTQYK